MMLKLWKILLIVNNKTPFNLVADKGYIKTNNNTKINYTIKS